MNARYGRLHRSFLLIGGHLLVGIAAADVVLVSSVLPTSRSVTVGTTATAFATILNAGDVAGTGCTMGLRSDLAATFTFQTTDPMTNAVVGAAGEPVMIDADGSQSFVIALTPTEAFDATDVTFDYTCENGGDAAPLSGINTLLLAASEVPVPDVVALSATLKNDGFVEIPGVSGTGAFAVATINLGAAGELVASADTGTPGTAVALSLCETDPVLGSCINPASPATSVTTVIGSGATPTFAVFANGLDTIVPDPAKARIFVRFRDSGGTVRGATSVAVKTDLDQDDDGVADADDAFPEDPLETVDTDGDGVGNNADVDDDGDGVADAADAFPLDALEWSDSDGDGVGDNAESLPRALINEFLASNDQGLEDEDGDTSDWIELYNPGSQPVALAGWVLADGPDNRWVFPDVSLGPGEYLVIFASGKDRSGPFAIIDGISNLHTNFKLARGGEYLVLEAPDGTAHPANVFDPEFPEQATDVSYGRDAASDVLRFFALPTPGSANRGEVYLGVVDDTTFTVDRGFYTEPFEVSITTATEGATIRYTLDGSTPTTDHGQVYSGPIGITGTAVLRAAAFLQGWVGTNVDTQTYLFVADVVNQSANGGPPGPGWPAADVNGQQLDYGMDPEVTTDPRYRSLVDLALLDIPSVSLVTDLEHLFDPDTGIYVNATQDGRDWERPTSVELIDPDGGDGFQIDAGLRIRGGYSRQDFNPKHAFRLFFRDEYGAGKLEFPLFGEEGVDSFDKIDLRTSQNYSWSMDGSPLNAMVRDVFNRDAQRDMGHPYTRSRFYHLYLNGTYWGIFQTQERAEARYAATYFGGDPDDYDVVKVDSGLTIDVNDVETFRSYTMEATDGNLDAWHRLWEIANQGFNSDANYYAAQGRNPDRSPNPDFDRLLDIDNLIDYMLIIFYGGNIDSPITRWGSDGVPNNVYAIYNRVNPAGFISFVHDAEHTLLVGDLHGFGDELYTDRTGPLPAGKFRRHSNPQWIHQQLAEHPEYRLRIADRAHRALFNDGPLTPPASATRLLARVGEIDLAIIAESARWGDAGGTVRTRDDDWLPTIDDLLDIWIPQRTAIVLDQLRRKGWYPGVAAPAFSINGARQHGGEIQAGDLLTIENPGDAGTIYFTTDGTDPREPGAYTFAERTVVPEDATKRVRVPTNGLRLYQDGEFHVTVYRSTVAVDSLERALAVTLDESKQRSAASARAESINFLNTGPGGHYQDDLPFPGTTLGFDANDFVVEVWSPIHIPLAGTWTFGVRSDDGFRLSVGGREGYHGGRAPDDTLMVFEFRTAGVYDLRLLYFERAGGAELELFAARGAHDTWNATDFHLIGSPGGLPTLGSTWTSPDFNDAGWSVARGGIGYDRDQSCANCYRPYISLDLESAMFERRRSSFVRIPFTLTASELAAAKRLALRIRYDDGFIAHLNGVEVARSNAPPDASWDAGATAARDDALAVTLTEFRIADKIPALRKGANVLAIQGLNIALRSSDFLISAELELGEQTGTSQPTAGARVYSGGVTLDGTTEVRARVLVDGTWSAVNAGTYSVPATAD